MLGQQGSARGPQLERVSPITGGRRVPVFPRIQAVAIAFAAVGLAGGFWMGQSGSDRQVVAADRAPVVAPAVTALDESLVAAPRVDEAIQQGYYATAEPGAWVVCSVDAGASCVVAAVRASWAAADDASAYLAAADPGPVVVTGMHFVVGADLGSLQAIAVSLVAEDRAAEPWRLTPVTLNGCVHYVDLGELAPGRYHVVVESPVSRSGGAGPQSIEVVVRAQQ